MLAMSNCESPPSRGCFAESTTATHCALRLGSGLLSGEYSPLLSLGVFGVSPPIGHCAFVLGFQSPWALAQRQVLQVHYNAMGAKDSVVGSWAQTHKEYIT